MKLIKKYLDALQANELAVERLYKIYADRFKEDADFWLKLATEERMHASIIDLLMADIEAHDVKFAPAGLALDEVIIIIEKAKKRCDELEAGAPLELRSALELAVKLECGMLEHSFFTFFNGSSPAFAADMTALKKHTEAHLQAISEKLDACALIDTNEQCIGED